MGGWVHSVLSFRDGGGGGGALQSGQINVSFKIRDSTHHSLFTPPQKKTKKKKDTSIPAAAPPDHSAAALTPGISKFTVTL